jgi:hypothetical protein
VGHTVAFVDSIAASPTTRLNLNDGSTWTLLDRGTEFPPPSLRRAVVSNLLVDGAHIAASAYDNRQLTLRLNLQTASEDTSATQLQTLFRELDRPYNILKFAPTGATNPVHFRTFRSDASAVREVLASGGLRELEVTLWAEPFAYGTKVTGSPATVTNDPAATWYVDVTSVKGDVETPAVLTITYSGVEDKGPTAFAVRRHGTPSSAPVVLQAEAMTGGTNTTIQANNAVWSGAGQNSMRCTFGTATMQDRLTSSVHPSSASTDARGVYRVFLRGAKTVAGDVINVQLRQTSGTQTATNTAVAWPASTTNRRWVDLGLVQIPFGPDPIYDGLSNVEAAARGTIFTVRAERTSGSGNLDFDVLAFMPADDRFCMVSWPTSSGPTSMVVDGPADLVYPIGGSGEIYPQELVARTGGLPMLSPGQTNRIYALLNAGGDLSTVNDDITSTISVTASYWPRYLYVRPAST